jgi:hypothetical protein
MDWIEICNDLWRKADSLADAVTSPPEEREANQKELFLIEARERPVVDEAARQYARTGQSPILTPHQSLLLYIRIGHAAQFARLLAEAMAGSSRMFLEYYTDSQKASVFEFLLVDYWHFAGCSRWRTT